MSKYPDYIETDKDGRPNFVTVKDPGGCEHLDFDCLCNVDRVSQNEGDSIWYYICEVQVRCKGCGCLMSFEALPRGFNRKEPTSSVFGLRASLPMHPFTDADTAPERLRYEAG